MENYTKEKQSCNRKKVNVYSYARWSSNQQSNAIPFVVKPR